LVALDPFISKPVFLQTIHFFQIGPRLFFPFFFVFALEAFFEPPIEVNDCRRMKDGEAEELKK
jgi:hypothetical protein